MQAPTSRATIPAEVKGMLTPTKFKLTATKFVTIVAQSNEAARNDFVVNHETKPLIISMFERARLLLRDLYAGRGTSGTWGALRSRLKKCRKMNNPCLHSP